MFLDKSTHQIAANLAIYYHDIDSEVIQKFFISAEILIFTNHNVFDSELENGARTHHAGRQSRKQSHFVKVITAARALDTCHFGMENLAPPLDALIATYGYDVSPEQER